MKRIDAAPSPTRHACKLHLSVSHAGSAGLRQPRDRSYEGSKALGPAGARFVLGAILCLPFRTAILLPHSDPLQARANRLLQSYRSRGSGTSVRSSLKESALQRSRDNAPTVRGTVGKYERRE